MPGITWPPDDGVTNDPTPTIQWNAIDGAVRYQVRVEDGLGSGLRESHSTGSTAYRTQVPLTDRQVAYATVEAYEPALRQATSTFFGDSASFERIGGPREPFAVRIKTGRSASVDDSLARA